MTITTKRYRVEKGIPIGEPYNSAPSPYPFKSMKKGDSFKFYRDDVSKIRSAASKYGTRHKKKFSVIGMRCWRTK